MEESKYGSISVVHIKYGYLLYSAIGQRVSKWFQGMITALLENTFLILHDMLDAKHFDKHHFNEAFNESCL